MSMPKFKAPFWCKLKHKGIKDAIFGAAEEVGAKIYMSASFIFNIDDFEHVERHFKKHGKDGIVKAILDHVHGKEGAKGVSKGT